MRAHQIMTKDVITVTPRHARSRTAAKIMLRTHISGLPVLDDAGKLVGIVSESDFLRRSEIGTGRKRPRMAAVLASARHALRTTSSASAVARSRTS